MPDVTKQFRIETDASNYATGAILSQQDNEGKWHPCAYLSKSMAPAERNYDIYDKELLAIMRALEEWRHYLEGAPEIIDIHTDHKNLSYFRDAHKLTQRQARWALFLSRFNFILVHKPGREMFAPDALSRRPDHLPDEGDNQEVILLPSELFSIGTTDKTSSDLSSDDDLITQIKEYRVFDDEVLTVMESLLAKGPSTVTKKLPDWETIDGLLLYKGRIYVPKNDELRRQIIKEHHDSKITGHPGRYKTTELVQRTFWWLGMTIYIRNYVSGCAICQNTKILTH